MISLIQSDNICSAIEETLKHAVNNSPLERRGGAAGDGVVKPTFIIVPDRFTLQAERILLSKKSCLFNVRVVTFSMLYVILSESKDLVLDKTSAVLFMWRAIQEVKKDLTWFSRSAGHYAFAEKMFNTVNQLTSSMVDFDKLEINAKSEITKKKMHDIALIRGAYIKLIAKYTDSSGVLGWLIENIRHSKLIKDAKIFITGFQHLSIQRGVVVAELMKHASEFTAGYQKGSEFENMLAEVCLNKKLPSKIEGCRKRSEAGYSCVDVFTTIQDEATWVAGEICRLVGEGVRFRDIVVVTDEETVFSQIFAESGIAVNVDVGEDLLSHPLTQYMKEYLLLAATGSQMHYINIIKNLYHGLSKEEEFELENNVLKTGARGNEKVAAQLKKCKTAREFCKVLDCFVPRNDDIASRKILELFEIIGKISGEQKITILEFVNMFIALASATKVSDIPTLADAVMLVSASEYVPSFMPYVFVTGAEDGKFPTVQDDTDIITMQDIANTSVHIEPSASLQNARNRRHAKDILQSGNKVYVSYTGQNPSELVNVIPSLSRDLGSAEQCTKPKRQGLDPSTALRMTTAEQLFFPEGKARVTQLENFRKCPYYHFLENGLQLRLRKRNRLASDLMGTIIHKLAEEFTREIIKVGRGGLEGFDAEAEMKKVIERVLYMEEFRHLATDAKNAPVISNLKKEAKLLAKELVKVSDFFPTHVEMPLQGEIEGVIVRGVADRVDTCGDKAIIIDYKTGTIDRQSLQLPLYIQMFKGAEKAFYYSLKPGNFKMVEAKGSSESAGEIVRAIKCGMIAPNPVDKKVCRYCVARVVCPGGEHED